MDVTTEYNMKIDDNLYDATTENVSILRDMIFHFEKIKRNEINDLIANTNWDEAYKDKNIDDNTIFFYDKSSQIVKGLTPLKKKIL